MRLIICLSLLIGCNTHTSIPVGATVVEGTFIGLTPSGEGACRLTLTYADPSGNVLMERFCVATSGVDGVGVFYERLDFAGNPSLSQGDRFKIVKDSPVIVNGSALPVYKITKLE